MTTTTTTTHARSDNLIRDEVLFELKWDPKITSNDIATSALVGLTCGIQRGKK